MLKQLAKRYLSGMRPNAGVGPVTGFLFQLQEEGSSMDAYSEEDWRGVLEDEFQIPADLAPDYLEEIASWGVVDD